MLDFISVFAFFYLRPPNKSVEDTLRNAITTLFKTHNSVLLNSLFSLDVFVGWFCVTMVKSAGFVGLYCVGRSGGKGRNPKPGLRRASKKKKQKKCHNNCTEKNFKVFLKNECGRMFVVDLLFDMI